MDKDKLKTPISVLEYEIKLLIDNIDYLNKKNEGHQKLIDGNNELILEMDYVVNNMQNAIKLIKQNELKTNIRK